MNGEIDLEQKTLKMKLVKKNSLQVKTKTHKLNKHFPILQKTKILKAYSTKLVSNFVPTLRPKQSFCKPAFMQLNQNQPKIEIEKEDSDLDIISSSEGIDELDSESNQSSSMTSSNEEIDKEEEKLPDNDIQMNNISSFGLNSMNVDIDKNKIVQEIPEYKMFNEEKNNLKLNKINNNNINNNDAQANENKNKNKNKENNNLTQNIINSKKRPLTILDVLKNKNKMIK